jgi:chitin disaccharide deacetylase
MREIIITGDDFGLSASVNEAIERAHRFGVLRSASLMVGSPAAAEAVRIAQSLPSLHVGLHVCVVAAKPVLPPARLREIVDEAGLLSDKLVASGFNFCRPAARRQLAAEIRAQFDAYRATGLPLDHADAHNHLHVHPLVLGLIIDIGRDYGLRAVRVPYEPFDLSWRACRDKLAGRLVNTLTLTPWSKLAGARLRGAGIAVNDRVFGVNDTGDMTASRVARLIDHLPDGVTELYVHPTTQLGDPNNPRGTDELDALTSPLVASALARSGATIISYGDLAARLAAA